MYSFIMPLLQCPPSSGGTEGGGGFSGIVSFLPFIAIIAIFYFLIIRPQNKKQKETKRMLEALKKGDKIITIGGIHGTIHTVKEGAGTVIVKVDDGVKLEFSRSAVSSVEVSAKEEKADKIEKSEDKEEPLADNSESGEK